MSVASSRHDKASDVVERTLELSRQSDCVVILGESFEAELRFANNTTTTNGQRHNRHVSVISFCEKKEGTSIGVASKSGWDDLEELVAKAEHDCAEAPAADDASALVRAGATGDNYFDASATTDMSALSGVLDALPDAFDRAESGQFVLAGFAKHDVSTVYLGTSAGVRRRFVQPDGTLELVARSVDGSRSAWASAGTPDFSDVSIESLQERLAQRMGWAQNKVDLGAGRYEVILPPDAVADLMIPLEQAASGRDAEDGQSVFSSAKGTRIGESICSLPLSLVSDPSYGGLSCAPFLVTSASGADVSVFDNGMAVGRVEWIKNGALHRLCYHRAGAAKAQAEFTPPGENLILSADHPSGSLEDLIRSTKRGLLLTCLWYIREVDPTTLLLTGLTRDGVYLVVDGEVAAAVNNFRFNESPVDLLGRVSEAGSTERALSREWNEWMSRTAMPALRVADFNMSSVSPAS